jgi:hypothetical protein
MGSCKHTKHLRQTLLSSDALKVRGIKHIFDFGYLQPVMGLLGHMCFDSETDFFMDRFPGKIFLLHLINTQTDYMKKVRVTQTLSFLRDQVASPHSNNKHLCLWGQALSSGEVFFSTEQ